MHKRALFPWISSNNAGYICSGLERIESDFSGFRGQTVRSQGPSDKRAAASTLASGRIITAVPIPILPVTAAQRTNAEPGCRKSAQTSHVGGQAYWCMLLLLCHHVSLSWRMLLIPQHCITKQSFEINLHNISSFVSWCRALNVHSSALSCWWGNAGLGYIQFLQMSHFNSY